MKKMIYLLSCLLMVFTLTNCTSNNTDESGDEVASEDSIGEESSDEMSSEDGEAVAEESGAVTEEGGDEGFGEESLPTEEVAEAPAEGSDPSLEQPAEVAAQTETPSEVLPTESVESAGVDLGTPPDAMADGTVETAMTEAPAPELQSSESTDTASTDTFASAPTESFANQEAPKPVASLKKIELAPFNRAGQLLNAVYVARPGDDFTTISQMIYGSPDKADSLKQANAWITTLRAGDKVYYNSPMRPTDSTKLLTFYEEQGVPSEVYTVGAGEDLKAVSAKLLGYPNAWKEVWATNLDIESKGELSEGTQLRYWKNAGNFAAKANQAPAPTAEVAANMPPPPMPEEFAQADMPPPPPMDAMNPPPPMPEEFAQADMPPPPPMMEEASLPPPPQQPAPAAVGSMDEEQAGMDNDMMMNLAGAAIAAAALGAFVMIRRKKAREKEISQAFDSTQVG